MIEPIEVCAAVIMHGGRLLLATRPKGTHLEGHWEFPGGKVKADETLAACIIRELQEELGLQVRQAFLLFEVLHHYPEKTIRLHFLLCDIDLAQTFCPQEGQRFAWFQADQLPLQTMVPADRKTVDYIRQGQWVLPEDTFDEKVNELPVLRNPELTALLQDFLNMNANLKVAARSPRPGCNILNGIKSHSAAGVNGSPCAIFYAEASCIPYAKAHAVPISVTAGNARRQLS